MSKHLFYFLLLSCVLQLGCKNRQSNSSVAENSNLSNKKCEVIISITHHLPYCKGVAPQSIDEYNVIVPEANKDFFIINEADSTFKLEFKTDDSGTFSISLLPGKYCVKRADKNTDFESFLKANKGTDSEYIIFGDRDCYYKWWSKCEGSFEVLESDLLPKYEKIQVRSSCFTGEDPCKFYNGPMPP